MQNMNYSSYEEEPFLNPYDSFFAHLIEKTHPHLLRKHYDIVFKKSQEIQKIKDEIYILEQQKEKLLNAVASNKYFKKTFFELASNTSTLERIGEILITIGLCSLLFISMSTLLVQDVENIFLLKNILKTTICFVTAICINIAEKLAFEKHVKYHKLTNPESRFNWRLVGIAFVIIVVETSFASYGLLTIISKSRTLERYMSIIGVSIAVIVNIMYAWSTGLEKAEFEKKYLEQHHDKYKEIANKRFDNIDAIAMNEEKKQDISQRLKFLRKILKEKELKLEKEKNKWQKFINKIIETEIISGKPDDLNTLWNEYREKQI